MKHKRDDLTVDFVWDRQRLFDRDVVQVDAKYLYPTFFCA